MEICQTCHKNGRSLWKDCCLCTGDVLKPSEFIVWNAKRRVHYDIPQPKIEVKQVVFNKPKLVFGQRIQK